jgi:ankyrin repeat protein
MQTVRELIADGADIQEHHGVSNYTPLHLAVQRSHPDVVQLLLELGADVHATTSRGFSCLHLIVLSHPGSKRDEAVIDLLHAHGAQVDVKDARGRTPVHLAADSGWSSIFLLKKFVGFGADLSVTDNDGNTVLHFAAGRGIECKYEPEFYLSTRAENRRVVRFLLKHKQGGSYAALCATNRHGKTPEYWAHDDKTADVIEAAIEPARRVALVAVAMGQHTRLGEDSLIGSLEPDLLRLVASYM